ncbi:threonine/serine dehydratase [Pseudomonas sp. PDM26]|uniref:threonine ammonia-lyase n=1 Tax=unclassified Pseudomonas TaxID=196821 RepID=UPI000BB30B23|nr:threonine/serine dehydratase [Pseudomonas sp. ACN5]MBV7547325.1 threonine/serine dehydratase [Pseudomonas sp. PDM26]
MQKFDLDLILKAQRRLQGQVVRTPLLSSAMLNDIVGADVYVKAECLQKTGAFKFRGAMFKLAELAPSDRNKGVITYSAGNHGQAVAAAAHQWGCPSVVVMPEHAPKIKQDNCRWWGAEVVLYNKDVEDREDVTQRLIESRGLTFVSPFDDPLIMAGQGTIGLEIAEQLAEVGATPDSVWLGCSGGGLASGTLTAMRAKCGHFESVLVEAEGYTKWQTALQKGEPVKLQLLPKTLLDGIAGPAVGALPFEVLKPVQPRTEVAYLEDAFQGMRAAFQYLKLVLEPGGAAALGTLIREKQRYEGKTVVVVCSGGNVDPEVFLQAWTH